MYDAIDKIKVGEQKYSSIILYLVLILALYNIYRKINELKLTTINMKLGKIKNNILVQKCALKLHCEILENNNEIIIVKYPINNFIFKQQFKFIFFIITDDAIKFTVLNNYSKINPPVLFTHLKIKKTLKQYLAILHQ